MVLESCGFEASLIAVPTSHPVSSRLVLLTRARGTTIMKPNTTNDIPIVFRKDEINGPTSSLRRVGRGPGVRPIGLVLLTFTGSICRGRGLTFVGGFAIFTQVPGDMAIRRVGIHYKRVTSESYIGKEYHEVYLVWEDLDHRSVWSALSLSEVRKDP
jgi:hypothetical protein